ncbi:MAG TPA: thioredoxin-like domain-containing protein [Gemmataceae bacterium]|jgi:thiol-disulfide isomerase/thioredoxin|nr:thioredoxin-like domain-containing protein [Gemmataceae bacterium]
MFQVANRPAGGAFRRLSFRWLMGLGLLSLAGLACVWGAQKWQGGQPRAAGEPHRSNDGRRAAERSPDTDKHQLVANEARQPEDAPGPPDRKHPGDGRIRAPELAGGVAWLNTAGPIRLKDLRGKVVLLDFWTFCCINCMHVMPDLAKLEQKYPNELVVIGVHSAKFNEEKDSENIRKAILRYELSHPVVNDANLKIWEAYGVQQWPTYCLIDPEGYYLGATSSEGKYDVLDRAIAQVIKIHRAKKTLNERPLRFELARYHEKGDSPLFFPGKVLADARSRRLFIADSTHHRIVITDLDGKMIAVAGVGEPGATDGPFDKAGFNDPQGMALKGNTLYVADRKNHLIRALDLKARTVKTVAGTGEQGRDSRRQTGPGLKVGLNSPWDLCLVGDTLYMAMAGHHQIWALDLNKDVIEPFVGLGYEDIHDGPGGEARFAQPSGLASDGTTLYVADSEASAVRAISLADKEVKTLVGVVDRDLFQFGDVDGVGKKVRLQHALGIAYREGKLYVADTYNSKIKVLDPDRRSCKTFAAESAGWLTGPLFKEPGGLSFAGDKLYVADTNGHRIRVVDLKTRAVRTLALRGVAAPKPVLARRRPVFPNPVRTRLRPTTVPGDGELTLQIKLLVPRGSKLNPQAKMAYVVETLPGAKASWSEIKTVPEVKPAFSLTVPAGKLAGASGLRLSLVYYECGEGSAAICRIKSQIWEVPLAFDAKATSRVIQLSGAPEKNDKKRG